MAMQTDTEKRRTAIMELVAVKNPAYESQGSILEDLKKIDPFFEVNISTINRDLAALGIVKDEGFYVTTDDMKIQHTLLALNLVMKHYSSEKIKPIKTSKLIVRVKIPIGLESMFTKLINCAFDERISLIREGTKAIDVHCKNADYATVIRDTLNDFRSTIYIKGIKQKTLEVSERFITIKKERKASKATSHTIESSEEANNSASLGNTGLDE